jgi:inner membrane protein
MPTIRSHPVVPLALVIAMGSKIIPTRLVALGVLASVLPDLYMLAFFTRRGLIVKNQLEFSLFHLLAGVFIY